MTEIAKKDEICKANWTGKTVLDIPEIIGSDLIMVYRKLDLNYCLNCDDNTSYQGDKVCLKTKDDYYKIIAKRL